MYNRYSIIINIVTVFFSQSISPGLVRTEFAARLKKSANVKTVQDGMGDVRLHVY